MSRAVLCVHEPRRAVQAHNINGKKGGGQTELPGLSSRRTAHPVAGTMGLPTHPRVASSTKPHAGTVDKADTSDRQRSTSNKLTKE